MRIAVIIGPHADSVSPGDTYDGQPGVLDAPEALRALDEHGVRTRHSVAYLSLAEPAP